MEEGLNHQQVSLEVLNDVINGDRLENKLQDVQPVVVDYIMEIFGNEGRKHVDQKLHCVQYEYVELRLISILQLLLAHDLHVHPEVNCQEGIKDE